MTAATAKPIGPRRHFIKAAQEADKERVRKRRSVCVCVCARDEWHFVSLYMHMSINAKLISFNGRYQCLLCVLFFFFCCLCMRQYWHTLKHAAVSREIYVQTEIYLFYYNAMWRPCKYLSDAACPMWRMRDVEWVGISSLVKQRVMREQ